MRATRPSRTAIGVARALIGATSVAPFDAVLPPDAADWTRRMLSAISPRRRREVQRMERRWFQRVLRAMEEHGPLRGGLRHVALRKRYVDDRVRDALANGATQVLVLGAGLDTLALRLALAQSDAGVLTRASGPRLLEVDHPATQALKQRVLSQLGVAPDRFHRIPLDLSRASLSQTLRAHDAFQAGARTVIVAEGLLMYLAQAHVVEIFDLVRTQTAPGSRLVFSFIEADARGRHCLGSAGWFVRPLLRALGEPFRFGVARADLAALLAQHGLALREQLADVDLIERYAPAQRGATCLGWEYVATAEY